MRHGPHQSARKSKNSIPYGLHFIDRKRFGHGQRWRDICSNAVAGSTMTGTKFA
jgi:hypothetical protein